MAARRTQPPLLNGEATTGNLVVKARRIHRRDLNRETVEYQRRRSKKRFLEVYEEDGVEQLVFESNAQIVGYAECALEITGADNWMNQRYFDKHDMDPMCVEELAVHPDFHGQGIGGFVLEQLEHLSRVRGCTHLVLEVAENNESALHFYRARSLTKLAAAIFMTKKTAVEADLLPPRKLRKSRKIPGES